MDPAKRDPSVPPEKVWSGKMPNLLYVPTHFPEICLILRAGSGSLKHCGQVRLNVADEVYGLRVGDEGNDSGKDKGMPDLGARTEGLQQNVRGPLYVHECSLKRVSGARTLQS